MNICRYIVSLLGICTHNGVCIVLELVPHGALEEYLRTMKKFSSWVKEGMPYVRAFFSLHSASTVVSSRITVANPAPLLCQ
jgi:hypothetical protein